MMEAKGPVFLPGVSPDGLKALIKILPQISEKNETALKDHFNSLLKDKKFEDYGGLFSPLEL